MKLPHIVLGLLISISANTYADIDQHNTTAPDLNAGQSQSASCQGCHGPDGNSYSPDWPNLAQQGQAYLVKQIEDFQSGARKDPTMSSMVIGLSKTDIRNIAAYFSAQTISADPAAKSSTGKKLYMGGNRYKHVPACAGCHGPNGVGNGPAAIPRLAGQKAAYTAKALRDFKSKARSNDANQIMQEIAAKMSEQEIDAVSLFVSGMAASSVASQ
jgi:cytochrome c553